MGLSKKTRKQVIELTRRFPEFSYERRVSLLYMRLHKMSTDSDNFGDLIVDEKPPRVLE